MPKSWTPSRGSVQCWRTTTPMKSIRKPTELGLEPLRFGFRLSTLGLPLLAVPRITTFVFGRLLTEVAELSPHHIAASAAAAAAGATASDEPTKPVIRSLNALEKVLGRFAGMMCIVLAALIVVQTGTVPLTTHAMTARSTSAPYRKPTIWISVAFFTMLAYSAYNLNILSVAIPSAAVSAWGFWVVIFAHQGKVNQVSSKTSSFPFKNVAAEEKKEEQRNKRE
ncbi:hypothetical protein BMF94_6913 [Rhodotorula taiwanensis]|uniref:Uncharacterized protein n=1 Tax=Rhodotorula taiwanensis TaxID=741276 RepID=A0A2S5AZX5_9BASI|nr:hypothetical protein BMF94_6913 [Rhodotorula taiwanensis]